MAFEREAIESTSAIPTHPQAPLREERVLSPYQTDAQRLSKASAAVAARSGQPDKVSSAAAEPASTAESVTLSPQMAALARKEQAYRQREQSQKAKDAELQKALAEVSELKAMKEAIATEDYSKLEGIVPYDKFTAWKLAQLNGTDPTQQELKKIAGELETMKKSQQDDLSKRFDAAVEDRRKEVRKLAETNPEFAPLKKGGEKVMEAAVQHILSTWEHDNIELSPEQAAKEVTEEMKRRRDWHNSLFEEAAAEPAAVEGKQLPPLKASVKTLTNNMTTGEIKRAPKSFQGMSDNERYAEARRRAEEKLKSQRG
jgi:hypothetical protein